MPIDATTAKLWWHYLDIAAHQLEAACYAAGPVELHRTPTNPRHTADFLIGEAMLCAGEVDERCRFFAKTGTWPGDLRGDEIYQIQHRLGCAKAALDFLTRYPEHENAINLQSSFPNGLNKTHLLEVLLIPIWQLFGDLFLEEQARQMQTLLPPGELERLREEDSPLQG